MNKQQSQGNLFILASTVLFALNIPIVKSLTPEWVAPEGLTMFRFAFATLAFWVASFFTAKEKVSPRDLLMLFVASLFGMSINQLLFIVGLAATSPIDSSIILTVGPVAVMLISAMWLKEPITFKKAIGVLIGGVGALLIVLSAMRHSGGGHVSDFTGNVLVFISTVIYALYLVMIKPYTQRYGTITLMKWMFLFASITALPYCYPYLAVNPEADFDVYLRIFYVVFGATFLAYLFVPLGLKRLRPTTVSMYNYAQPLIASFVAILVGQDTLTWEKPVSAVLVFIGVYLVIKSKSRAQVLAEEKAKEEIIK